MKKTFYAAMLLLGLSMTSVSCSTFSSPEAQAIKDAKAMNKALEKNDADAIQEAGRTMEKHLQKYSDDRDEYFRYTDTYKDNLIK